MIYTDEQLASEFLGAHRFRGNEVNRDDMGDWLSVVRRAKKSNSCSRLWYSQVRLKTPV